MSEGLDLTAAVEAAKMSDGVFQGRVWREVVEAAVLAAAPLIEAQVREKVAREIETEMRKPGRRQDGVRIGRTGGLQDAAAIARGTKP